MNARDHSERVHSLGCCVCRRIGYGYVPAQAHHVAEGSGLRSEWAIVPLCEEHHTGASGFHKRGKQFLSQFRVPGESEYGLLVWTIEDLAKYG
jgi:hypothetical protein